MTEASIATTNPATGMLWRMVLPGSPTGSYYDDLGEGGSTQDPCVQVEQQSKVIRERSCTPCHLPSLNAGTFNFILDVTP